MSRRPVAEGLLVEGDHGESHLIGVRCPTCGLVQFPRFWICPRCLDRERLPVPFALSGVATLEQFCVLERGPREFNPPYMQGAVRLAEGPVVYSLIRGVPTDEPGLEVGQEMRFGVEVVRVDEEGAEVVGWASRPAMPEGA